MAMLLMRHAAMLFAAACHARAMPLIFAFTIRHFHFVYCLLPLRLRFLRLFLRRLRCLIFSCRYVHFIIALRHF